RGHQRVVARRTALKRAVGTRLGDTAEHEALCQAGEAAQRKAAAVDAWSVGPRALTHALTDADRLHVIPHDEARRVAIAAREHHVAAAGWGGQGRVERATHGTLHDDDRVGVRHTAPGGHHLDVVTGYGQQ